MDEMLLQVPGEISKVETMRNGALKLRIDTQENVSPEVRAKIMMMVDKLGYFTFAARLIQPEDIADLPELKREEDGKSPAQRLRATLFVLFNQEKPEGGFELFYQQHMQKLIDFVKNKLT
jgi:hypothetical protein